jgi:hypothetical protein
MKASMGVLKKDKELIIFALLSGICCLGVLASFLIPIIMTESWTPPAEDEGTKEQVLYYGVLFLYYFCNYFVIVFFNAAIISCAIIRMKGGDPTLADGFKASFSRLPYIAGWALISATVGLVLRIIEDKNEKVGRFVAGLLGMAWTIVTFLAVPVLVVEKKGPIAALKESTALLKKTWGQQLAGNFGFGLIFFLLFLPAIGIGALGFAMGGTALFIFLGIAVLYIIVIALIQSTLQAIFQAAVYLFAKEGTAGGGFDQSMLQGAMRNK